MTNRYGKELLTTSQQEKLHPDEIVDDLKVCAKCCYKNRASAIQLYEIILESQIKSHKERNQDIVDLLNFSFDSKTRKFWFRLDHTAVCDFCLLTRLVISDKTLAQKINKFEKDPTIKAYFHGNTGFSRGDSKATEAAEVWLKNQIDILGESDPVTGHTYLPPLTKFELYKQYSRDHELISQPVVSPAQFYKIWSARYSFARVPKTKLLGKCQWCCEQLDSLRKAGTCEKREAIRREWRKHIDFCREERKVYNARVKQASESSEFLSVVLDGMDQLKTCPPIFSVKGKDDDSCTKLKVRLMGAIVHGKETKKYGYFLTSEYLTDSNVSIECLKRTLEHIGLDNLPHTLYLQLDNTSKDNKNKKVFSFLASLVKKNIFKRVVVSFLPVGHTHCDIDALFGCFSRKLKKCETLTLDELLLRFKDCETPSPVPILVDSVLDYWKYLEPASVKIKGISEPRVVVSQCHIKLLVTTKTGLRMGMFYLTSFPLISLVLYRVYLCLCLSFARW